MGEPLTGTPVSHIRVSGVHLASASDPVPRKRTSWEITDDAQELVSLPLGSNLDQVPALAMVGIYRVSHGWEKYLFCISFFSLFMPFK